MRKKKKNTIIIYVISIIAIIIMAAIAALLLLSGRNAGGGSIISGNGDLTQQEAEKYLSQGPGLTGGYSGEDTYILDDEKYTEISEDVKFETTLERIGIECDKIGRAHV